MTKITGEQVHKAYIAIATPDTRLSWQQLSEDKQNLYRQMAELLNAEQAEEPAQTPDVEILHDQDGLRVVRLECGYIPYHGGYDFLAEMGAGLVTITHMHSKNKPRSFSLSPANMTRLAHAWLAFTAKQEHEKEIEQAEYRGQVAAMKERAKTLYATVEEDVDGLFTLIFENGPLAHVYRRFQTNVCLDLDDVKERLNAAQKMREEAQTGDCSKGVSNYQVDEADLQRRLDKLDVELHREAPGYYSLSFYEDHMFADFWHSNELMSIGQVEYRLRYMEGVLSKSTAK